LQTPTDEKPRYQISYWIHHDERIAVIRISDTVVQGWKAKGNDFSKDFEHSHFQTTYPSKERLDEYLQNFYSSNVDEYLQLQFDHHHFDDYFRKKANELKDKRFREEGKI
jgi:hypothetical protein